MATVVVYEKDTRKVIAAIPTDGSTAICMKGVEFEVYNATDPLFVETPNGLALAKNKFMINLGGQHGKEK